MSYDCSIYESQYPNGDISKEFASWFTNYVFDPTNCIVDEGLKHLALGPKRNVKTYPIFFVNGYKFNTKEYGAEKLTDNSGVFVKGSDDPNDHIHDFYGVLNQILQVTYFTRPAKEVFLFKCNWFSNVPGSGINVHPKYNLIEVRHTSHYYKYDPFVLAKQALQVYYAPYPSMRRDKIDWWAVFKTKARFTFDGRNIPDDQAYQADVEENAEIVITDDQTDFGPLNDESNALIDVFETTDEPYMEEEIESESESDEDD